MTNNINIPSKFPNESPAPTISPEAKLATLERQVTLADPNKPKPPLEAKPGDPFPPDVVPTKPPASGETPTGKAPPEGKIAEVKEGFIARMRDMGSQFGAKISGVLDTSGDAIKKGFASVTGIFGVGKTTEWLKGKSESISSWLSKEGMFQNILGGKDGWASNILSKILGLFGIKAAVKGTIEGVKEGLKDISGKYKTTYLAVEPFLIHGDGANLPVMDVLAHKDFQKLSLKELKEIQKSGDYSKIEHTLVQFPDKEKRGKTFKHLLSQLFDEKGFFSRTLAGAYKSGTKMLPDAIISDAITVEEYFQGASSVARKLKNIPKVVGGGLKGASGFITVNDKGDDVAGLSETDGDYELFSFSTPELRKNYLLQILTNKSRRYTPGEKDLTIKSLLENAGKESYFSKISGAEKKEVEAELIRLFTFADNFQLELASNPKLNLGMGDDLKKIISNKGFSLGGLLSLYYTLDGKTSYAQMSTIERAGYHSIITGVFGLGEGASSGKLAGKYAKKLEDSTDGDHNAVKEFLIEIAKWGTIKVAGGIWEGIQWAAGFIAESPKLGLGLLALKAPIFTQKTDLVGIIS